MQFPFPQSPCKHVVLLGVEVEVLWHGAREGGHVGVEGHGTGGVQRRTVPIRCEGGEREGERGRGRGREGGGGGEREGEI